MSSKQKPQSFEEFVKAATAKTAQPPVWEAWPKGALQEIAKVLDLNDSGQARVTLDAMAKRLVEVHKVRASVDILKRFVREVLNRRSWKQA